ncbi:hypothetical protein HME7025_00076 [Aquirufa nivalisilvae]|uniref:Uncharacterized protein n=1 Tax=Aquirufa nivalisilvae TaxID=2516557 RepID=A0A2S2DRD9_9BACT|nr:hypothetical protein [Aquirufa nivalisilvae]AWL07961.1 hypothetical protein HME7025_00076 [Aquirufa nivalisilvae]
MEKIKITKTLTWKQKSISLTKSVKLPAAFISSIPIIIIDDEHIEIPKDSLAFNVNDLSYYAQISVNLSRKKEDLDKFMKSNEESFKGWKFDRLKLEEFKEYIKNNPWKPQDVRGLFY